MFCLVLLGLVNYRIVYTSWYSVGRGGTAGLVRGRGGIIIFL
jgi:hypothetical protein